MPRAPPRPDGVVQQELHHVVLGEELRHGGQRPPVDLLAALVDLLLLLRSARTGRPTRGCRRRVKTCAAGWPAASPAAAGRCSGRTRPPAARRRCGRSAAASGWRIAPPGRTRSGPAVSDRGQFLALLQGDRHAVRVHEQVVLGQEPGEQHPVPVFVGEFLGELVDLLGARPLVPHVARLPAPGPEPVPELLVRGREVLERLGDIDRPPLERTARAAASARSRAWTTTFSSCRAKVGSPAGA